MHIIIVKYPHMFIYMHIIICKISTHIISPILQNLSKYHNIGCLICQPKVIIIYLVLEIGMYLEKYYTNFIYYFVQDVKTKSICFLDLLYSIFLDICEVKYLLPQIQFKNTCKNQKSILCAIYYVLYQYYTPSIFYILFLLKAQNQKLHK